MDKQLLSWDDIPKKLLQLEEKLDRIGEWLEKNFPEQTEGDAPLSIEQASDFINMAVSSIYKLVQDRKIPHYKAPDGKKLYFYKRELTDFIKGGERRVKAA